MAKDSQADPVFSVLRQLDFPLVAVDLEGRIRVVSVSAEARLPSLRGWRPGDSFFAKMAEPPANIQAWLEEARFVKNIRLREQNGGLTGPLIVKSQPLDGAGGVAHTWVLNIHLPGGDSALKFERETLLRISSVPIPEMTGEGQPLTAAQPQASPITGDLLGLVATYLHAEGSLLVRLGQFQTLEVVGQYGLAGESLARILKQFQDPAQVRSHFDGVLGSAATSGFTYALAEDEFAGASLATLAQALDFPCREIWVDGIGGFGSAAIFFREPPSRAARQFSTDAITRLGRHLESAMYANNMYEAYVELRRTQEQMVQSSKMAAIGELATGMAHELRQPVTVINNFFSTIFDHLEAGRYEKVRSRLAEYRHRSRRNIDRLTRIIDHLRNFGRQDPIKFRPRDVRLFIEEVFHTFLEAQLANRRIGLTISIPDDLPKVEMDIARIEQVILNLISNARDAVEGRPEPTIALEVERLADLVRISVTDNGAGIPPEDLDRIFDPFFTTKPVGQGTGLGLSISHSIVEGHNGTLEVKNLPEGGVRSALTLPIKQRKKKAAAADRVFAGWGQEPLPRPENRR